MPSPSTTTRDDQYVRPMRKAPTSAGCARFIGRVGALAVALGLGAAIAGSPGIAWADGKGSGSSSSSGSASSDSSASSPASSGGSTDSTGTSGSRSGGGPTSTVSASTFSSAASSKRSERGSSGTDDDTSTDVTDAGDAPVDVKSTVSKNRSTSESRAVVAPPADRDPIAGAVVEPSARAETVTVTAETVADQPRDVVADDTLAVVDKAPPPAQLAAADTVAPAAATAPAPPRIGLVSGLVSGLLTAVGLHPQATDGPVAPAEPPTLWALLGWVRREIGHALSPASASMATAAATTSLTVSPTPTSAPVLPTVSPLGTSVQLEAESTAARTVRTLPVALAKLVLRLGFQLAAQQQFSLVGGPDQANLDRLSAAVDEYAMATAFQQQILNSNTPTLVAQVAPPHTWYGQMVPGSRILYDNPDTIYRFMGVNGASSYVITGRFTDEVPTDTTFSVLTGFTGITASVLTKDELVVNDDGTFTITADSTPADGRTNHLQLPNDATLIATRNTLADWNTEVPMSLDVIRVGGPPNSLFSQLGGFAIPVIGPLVVGNPLLTTLVSVVPPMARPPALLRGSVSAIIMLLGIRREATYIAVATTDPQTGEQLQPNVLKDPARNAEFLATQLQSAGYFQLADDEALVVTIDKGNAGYFVLPITDDWTITDDYWNEQTSLNSAQAIIDDGATTYTLVISKSDPGVANWVSTGGLNQGTISMRFQDLDPDAPDDLPTVSSQVVKLDDLASVLPAGTVYYDQAQRAEQLAIRKAGFDNRFAPYPQP